MDRRLTYFSAWMAALALGTIGCDRSDDSGGIRKSCKSFCDRLESCDDRTDLAECVAECRERDFLSSAYVGARARCALELSCNLWQDEVDNQGADVCDGGDCDLNECVVAAFRDVPRSAALQDECSAVANKLVACEEPGSARVYRDHCEQVAPFLSEGYLQASYSCVDAQCFDIAGCLNELADSYDADIRIVEMSAD